VIEWTAGALSAALNLYRGNNTAAMFAQLDPMPPPFKLPMPVLGIHPKDDRACLEGQMRASEVAVQEGKWTFKQVPGGHWFFVQEPDTLNKTLLNFLG
jgi:pimeloyl-ACP methyl ester carboxylesterase